MSGCGVRLWCQYCGSAFLKVGNSIIYIYIYISMFYPPVGPCGLNLRILINLLNFGKYRKWWKLTPLLTPQLTPLLDTFRTFSFRSPYWAGGTWKNDKTRKTTENSEFQWFSAIFAKTPIPSRGFSAFWSEIHHRYTTRPSSGQVRKVQQKPLSNPRGF